MNPPVLLERRGAIALVTINRPEKRNALNLAVVEALHEILAGLERDRELVAVIVTGAGEEFVAGADIAELRERGLDEALASINGGLLARLENLPVPVIAAVRGHALGGGCELALACDLRVAGRGAVFGQPEVGLGIVPGAGATWRLPRLIGLGRAKELIYTGRRVDADEALAMGLVNAVVDDDRVLDGAFDLAERIARQGRIAVRLAKLALGASGGAADTGSRLERLAQGILFESADKKDRMRAFLERRGDPRPEEGR